MGLACLLALHACMHVDKLTAQFWNFKDDTFFGCSFCAVCIATWFGTGAADFGLRTADSEDISIRSNHTALSRWLSVALGGYLVWIFLFSLVFSSLFAASDFLVMFRHVTSRHRSGHLWSRLPRLEWSGVE